MALPIRIYLVRHAVSQANLDKSVNSRLPDNQIPLADIGHEQAAQAGEFLAGYLGGLSAPRRARILCSPYRRTRETSAAIEAKLLEAGVAFDKREEIALREISFGLFDGYTDEELKRVFPREQKHYQKYVDFEGEFYAPMPMGESRVQVADRVKTVFGTILRDASPDRADPITDFIVVSHGVTIRAFLMQWLHMTPEWFEQQKNPNNVSINLIRGDGSAYDYETIYDGFPYDRTAQEEREEGSVRP